jgi:Trm5-related predicted tRNA methylase
MLPGEALADTLAELGVKSIASLVAPLNTRFKRNPFQETAVHMLVRDSKVNIERGLKAKKWFEMETKYGRVTYMWRGGEEVSESVHEKVGHVGVDHFIDKVDRFPIVAIYMGFYHIHTDREKRKLRMQVFEALSAVRTFCGT